MQQAVAGMFQAVADNFAENLQPLAAEGAGKQARAASELADTLLASSRVPSSWPKPIAIRPAFLRPSADFDVPWKD
jgi:hypothetical protein